MGHLGKTAGEDGHSFSGTPLTRILHADVRRNPDKWLQVPLEWDDHYPSPPQWADAMAKQRWDGWAAAHPGTAHPASDAVARTATELQKVAEYYGGFDELRLNECLTYVYLPDPHQHGFMVHVEVSDSEDQTVEKYLADIDPTDSVKAGNDYLQPGEKPFRSQLDPGLTPTSEAFTTDALGEGRKITAHGTADPRPSDPPGPPGVWAETRYAFAVPGRHDLVQVQARSSDPASLAAAAPDLDEFVRGITTKSAELTGIPAGPYDMDALALLRAVHDRRKLQTILRECVGLFCLWIGVAIAVHVWVPGRYNLHHRMDHDAVAGMFLLGAIAAVPAVRLFIDKTRDPVGEAAAALVSGVEPEVVQEEEFDLYGPEVARGLVPLLRQKPLLNLSALGFGVGALPMIVIGAVGIRDAPAVGIVFLAIGALSIYNTIGLARYFANSERYIQSTTADASLADSVAALASGRRIVINLDPGPGRITLGLPLDAKVPGANAPTSHAKLVGAAALSVVVLLGLGVRYSGHHHPGATEAVRRTVTLGYLTAATSRPNVTIRTGPDVHADVQALMSTAGIPTGQFGAGWQVVITQFFRTPNPDLDVADLVAELTIVDIKRTPCAVAVKAAISPPGRGKPTPTTLSGLPTGWLAVQRPGPDNQTRGVTFAGCQAGTLVAATVYSPYPSMPDKTIATSASRLVSAIAQRGLAQFRADTAP
jgi:hypothetical protein